jgi:hypothetical protein
MPDEVPIIAALDYPPLEKGKAGFILFRFKPRFSGGKDRR